MYILNVNNLLPGDIILTRSNSRISQLVREYTQSDYSHAILYVGYSSCIDSDGIGVQAHNTQLKLYEKSDDVLVLRLEKKPTNEQIENVIIFCGQKIGTQYSSEEAKLAIIKERISAKEKNRQFCTRFVAQAYSNSGLKLVENPDYCSPKDLYESELLKPVPNALRDASTKEIEYANEKEKLSKNQVEIHNEILKKARSVTKADIQTFEQLSKYVLDHPEQEVEITEIIKKSGYLEQWKKEKDKNPWDYDIELYLAHYTNINQRKELAILRKENEPKMRNKFQINLDTMRFGYKFYKQEYFAIQIELYEKLIELSFIREQTSLEGAANC